VGGYTAPLLPLYCSSSFFHAAGALFKAPASFNFSLKFFECQRRAFQKNASQSSRTVAVRRLNWHRSAIFQCQYDFSLCYVGPIACVHPKGARRRTGVPPTCHWKVAGRVEGCNVLPDGGPWGFLQSPNCKKRVPNSD
jgi:hypothetical protein